VPTDVLLAIAGMAATTAGLRVLGFLLADRLPRQGWGARWLQQIPAAVLAAIVAPAVAEGSWPAMLAAGAAALAAALTRNLLAAMAAGVAAIALLRQLG
jgi:branched-subunit amino acid transport protein